MVFRTKQQIGLELISRALSHGVRVEAWTFDEAYGRDNGFLDGLEELGQVFVAEVPKNFHGWVIRPRVLKESTRKSQSGRGRPKKYPRLAKGRPSSKVEDLFRYSPSFRDKSWQKYRIKDTEKGPEVWELKWSVIWRKDAEGLPGRRHCLLVLRNVLTQEVKYFVANRAPGDHGTTIRGLLRVAFQRCTVEGCFRQAKEELGLDQFEVRGWGCVHRHFVLVQLSQLFCAKKREQLDGLVMTREGEMEDGTKVEMGRITMEQVRRAMGTWLDVTYGGQTKAERLERELAKQRYYRRRNAQSRRSHTKTRRERYEELVPVRKVRRSGNFQGFRVNFPTKIWGKSSYT